MQKQQEIPSKDDIDDFKDDPSRKGKKQKRIDHYYIVTHYLSIASFLVFLGLLLLGKNVPDFFVGLIGSILGYYLSKKPFE